MYWQVGGILAFICVTFLFFVFVLCWGAAIKSFVGRLVCEGLKVCPGSVCVCLCVCVADRAQTREVTVKEGRLRGRTEHVC